MNKGLIRFFTIHENALYFDGKSDPRLTFHPPHNVNFKLNEDIYLADLEYVVELG